MPANSSTEVKKRQNGVSRDKVAFGTQAQGTGLQEAYPSQTIAHTSPAPVLLQAPLGQLILEWDSGVRGEDKELRSPRMAKYSTRSSQREYRRRGGAICVCL